MYIDFYYILINIFFCGAVFPLNRKPKTEITMMRLDKYLCSCGTGTRTEVKKIIKSKRVIVDGAVITESDFKVNEASKITLDGKAVEYNQYTYIMLNKPSGFLSATKDSRRSTIMELLDKKYHNIGLFPVGRLDKDTVGLVILTNDGDFAHNTLSPKKHVKKTYIAHIEGTLPANAAEIFNKGVTLKDFTCEPSGLIIERTLNNLTVVKVTIHEGKYHQIKRMFLSLGCKVVYLKRITFGAIELDSKLKEGEYRLLNSREMEFVTAAKKL